MVLTAQMMSQAMASHRQTQQSTAYGTLGGLHNSQYQTYGTSQELPAHQSPQAIRSSMSGVQFRTSMNHNAARPTTFPSTPEYQLGFQDQVPNHGSAMAFRQPLRQHIHSDQFGYAPMPNVQHRDMNESHGSYAIQHSSYAPHLGIQPHPVFVHNPGQQFHDHSGSTVQQHSTMGVSGPSSSQHPNVNPAFGAQAYAVTPRSFMQITNSGLVHNSVHLHHSVPMRNTLTAHTGPIVYNTPYALSPQPPVIYQGSNEAFSQPAELPTSYRHASHNHSVSNELYNGQQSGAVYNEVYLASRTHSGQDQLRQRSRKGQQEPQRGTTSIKSSTETLEQGHQHQEESQSPTEDIIQPHLESSTTDNRSATLPAEINKSISSDQRPSSLVGATAQVQPQPDGPSSAPSDILEEDKLDAPPGVDGNVPEGSSSSSAQELDISETPDELSLDFSHFVDRQFPELTFPHDPPAAAAFDEDNIKTWEMLSSL